jgi:uncharacterized membrane protein YqhA
MLQKIIRFALYVIVAMVLLNALFFIVVAVYKSVHAYILIGQGKIEEKPGVFIAESLDSFMIAIFFIIFSLGVSKLFLPKSSLNNTIDLPWFKIENFSQLKYVLWEVILTTILVFYTNKIMVSGDILDWTLLIIPGSVLMLAIAYKFMKNSH